MTQDDAEATVELMKELYFGRMWSRILPPGDIDIFGCLVTRGPSTREQIDAYLREGLRSRDGLESFAWDELHEYTDDELAANRDNFPELSGDARESAAEVMAAEKEIRQGQLAENAAYLNALGLPVRQTLAGSLDLLVACSVLLVDEDGRHRLNPDAPLPGEVLPLSTEESAMQDEMRWERLYERLSFGVIRLFRPREQLVVELQATLIHLAEHLKCDAESARHAVASLASEPDFTASQDVAVIGFDEPFSLRVDWEVFNSNRIAVVHGLPDEE